MTEKSDVVEMKAFLMINLSHIDCVQKLIDQNQKMIERYGSQMV